jgi:hypothetical protein
MKCDLAACVAMLLSPAVLYYVKSYYLAQSYTYQSKRQEVDGSHSMTTVEATPHDGRFRLALLVVLSNHEYLARTLKLGNNMHLSLCPAKRSDINSTLDNGTYSSQPPYKRLCSRSQPLLLPAESIESRFVLGFS